MPAALLALLSAALAANFPALTGRVVDQANIIPADSRADASRPKLADLEAKSGIQLVVATVDLARRPGDRALRQRSCSATWKLGEKTKNNGVLLLVAPNERRVRIEVGYGLEGTLTDALSKVIITNAITPRFKTGDFAGGITRGVDDIITVLTTDASEWQKRPSLRLDSEPAADVRSTGSSSRASSSCIGLMIVSPGFRWFMSRHADERPQLRRRRLRRRRFRRRTVRRRRLLGRRRIVRRRRRIGELVMDFSEQDRARISAAIRADEARTSGEIVCVLAQDLVRPCDGAACPDRRRARACAALAPDGLHHAVAAVDPVAAGPRLPGACSRSLGLPRVRAALMPRAARRALAHRAAMEQFVIRGIARKKDRTGILIFVSLAERYARIIADEGIAARVPQSQWQGAVDALIGHMRDGRIADGFIAAIESCGDVLATHFPSTGDERDELPDRIYLI